MHLVQHDVEAQGKGDHEEGVPEEEEEEGLQHLVEHRDVHVVPTVKQGSALQVYVQ
jgi:hypothetical protein